MLLVGWTCPMVHCTFGSDKYTKSLVVKVHSHVENPYELVETHFLRSSKARDWGVVPGFPDHFYIRYDLDVSKSPFPDNVIKFLKQDKGVADYMIQADLKRTARIPSSRKNSRKNIGSSTDADTDKNSGNIPKESVNLHFDDPEYKHQWYLDDIDGNGGNEIHIGVHDAWKRGYTGKGVVITVLDDGLEVNHPDIRPNYDHMASWDMSDNDSDPTPINDAYLQNKHGTRCAGEIAAVANNNKCGVGIAHGARIGGVRMLDGKITDYIEAASLSLNPQYIDIVSASWGPNDDGKTLEGPGIMARTALYSGIKNGRGGKGTIFVWASGNGKEIDDCNADGYANSPYTISVSSVGYGGRVPSFVESCSATLVSTPSSGGDDGKQISTTDTFGRCTKGHSGTSASAPMVVGVLALALEAKPELTWRDAQNLLVWTANWSKIRNLKDYYGTKNPDATYARAWHENAAGLRFHDRVGFGLLDTPNIMNVLHEPDFRLISPQVICDVKQPFEKDNNKSNGYTNVYTYILDMSNCSNLKYLESVQVNFNLPDVKRSNVEVYLESPSGTYSRLIKYRVIDNSKTNSFLNWNMTSVHFWGENPIGEWKLYVNHKDKVINKYAKATLLLTGTEEKSFYQQFYENNIKTKLPRLIEDEKVDSQPENTILDKNKSKMGKRQSITKSLDEESTSLGSENSVNSVNSETVSDDNLSTFHEIKKLTDKSESDISVKFNEKVKTDTSIFKNLNDPKIKKVSSSAQYSDNKQMKPIKKSLLANSSKNKSEDKVVHRTLSVILENLKQSDQALQTNNHPSNLYDEMKDLQ